MLKKLFIKIEKEKVAQIFYICLYIGRYIVAIKYETKLLEVMSWR
jgi:hypothetical protein